MEHHRAHLAAAFYASAFEQADGFFVDGFGDFAGAITASGTPDTTVRVHTVSANSNPDYHALTSEFWRLTGVPMVLNASFNESEPVVCTAVQAVACFERTGLGLLVIEDCVISRKCPAVHDNIA